MGLTYLCKCGKRHYADGDLSTRERITCDSSPFLKTVIGEA